MGAVLIAEFKNKKEADLVVELIGQMRSGKVLSRGKNVEDLYLGELIKVGYLEKGSVSITHFKKQLTKRISNII